jgi:hypothetical protein
MFPSRTPIRSLRRTARADRGLPCRITGTSTQSPGTTFASQSRSPRREVPTFRRASSAKRPAGRPPTCASSTTITKPSETCNFPRHLRAQAARSPATPSSTTPRCSRAICPCKLAGSVVVNRFGWACTLSRWSLPSRIASLCIGVSQRASPPDSTEKPARRTPN